MTEQYAAAGNDRGMDEAELAWAVRLADDDARRGRGPSGSYDERRAEGQPGRAAAAAQGAAAMENALTKALGVEWVRRDDGRGREMDEAAEADRLSDEEAWGGQPPARSYAEWLAEGQADLGGQDADPEAGE